MFRLTLRFSAIPTSAPASPATTTQGARAPEEDAVADAGLLGKRAQSLHVTLIAGPHHDENTAVQTHERRDCLLESAGRLHLSRVEDDAAVGRDAVAQVEPRLPGSQPPPGRCG